MGKKERGEGRREKERGGCLLAGLFGKLSPSQKLRRASRASPSATLGIKFVKAEIYQF